MIILDTSVWIEFLRARPDYFGEVKMLLDGRMINGDFFRTRGETLLSAVPHIRQIPRSMNQADYSHFISHNKVYQSIVTNK